MITFGPMPPLSMLRAAVAAANPITARAIRAAAAMALLLPPATGAAQTGVSHVEDATPIPAGMLRLDVANVWSRYDSRFAAAGASRPLGMELSTDSLGPRQLPNLAPAEQALRALSGNPALRLTLGRLDVRSDVRIVTTPIALEYGITRRLSVGVLVPVVQTRYTPQARVNLDTSLAVRSNIGVVPFGVRDDASSTNAGTVAALNAASSQITQLLTRCQQSPAASECDAVRGREPDAAAAAQSAAAFAAAVTSAYGTTSETAVIAPRAGSALAAQVDAQRAALLTRLRSYVPSTTIAPLFTAPTEFSYADLQGRNGVPGLLQSRLGGGLDSIRTSERIGLGDVELRARFLVVDRPRVDTLPRRGVQTRLAVGASVRFATSRPDSAINLVDIGTGEGAGVTVRSALDLATRRLGATVAARYERSFARSVDAPVLGFASDGFPLPAFARVSRTAGDLVGLDVTPRVFLAEWLAFEGQYGLERRGAATLSGNVQVAADPLCLACAAAASAPAGTSATSQLIGVGIRYSTVDAYLARRARYPVEVNYRHLEAVTGDAGAPKLRRDQIQMRIFYRLRRR